MSNAISINNSVLMGRLVRDPELRYTKDGTPVCSFKLAVARRTSGSAEKTDFIPCVAWREKAEFVNQWFSKGTLAIVIGQLTSRIWADEQGQNHIAFEILCDQVQFGETKRQRVSREAADKQAVSASEQTDTARGSVQIVAFDVSSGVALSGAVYDLYRTDDVPVQQNITGTDTGAHIVGLPADDYIITQTAAPSGYSTSNRSIYVTVEPGVDQCIKFPCTRQPASASTPQPQADMQYSLPDGLLDDDMDAPI